jgi:Helix-turn-helix domain
MTRPRPERMFQYPQESSQAPKRDKLLFTEAMMASGELTLTELRVGFLLASLWTHTHGYAHPPMQWIADALTLDKRQVGRALATLESKGWFRVEHGTRGRGKNHVNRYRPNVEKVTAASPFKAAVTQAEQRRAEQEKVTPVPVKSDSSSPKGDRTVTLSGVSLSGVLRTEPDTLRVSPCSPSNGADTHTAPQFVALKKLKAIAASPLLTSSNHPLTTNQRKTVEGWLHECDQLCELYDSHTGDPIGGMAYRLAQELSGRLQEDDERRARTQDEFEERRQQVLRDIESWENPCATSSPNSPAAQSAGSGGMVWRRPTVVEIAPTTKRGRGRPSVAPQIIALLPGLVAYHGNRIMLAEVTAATIAAGVVAPAERGTPNWNGRQQTVKRALAKADLGDIRIEGL